MNQVRKKRILLILLVLFGVGVSAGLTLYALRQNINLYFTPSQIHFSEHQHLKALRLGGMVKKNSVVKNADNLNMQFVITDFQAEIVVKYTGVLPALFKEGQGVIADGHFEGDGVFIATTILAKHDEKYMPPNMKAQQKVTELSFQNRPSEMSSRLQLLSSRFHSLSSRRKPGSSLILSRMDPGLRRDDNNWNLDDNQWNWDHSESSRNKIRETRYSNRESRYI